MPHLRKQPFHKVRPPADLREDEEVFFCKITNEIFRDYEAFFERIILCNSLVWSCAITGRSGMTFQEAEECEEKARRHLATFQDTLQRPLLFLATLTHRGRLADLNDDVFLFVKDRYFIGETVDVLMGGERRPSKIVKVMTQPDSSSKSNGDVIVIDEDSGSEGDNKRELPAADSMLYIVHPSTGKNNRVMVKATQVSRKKGLYTRDKSKLFLKQHCEPVNGVWSVKENVLQKMQLSEARFEDFYGGPRPKFQASVIKKKAGKKSVESASTTSPTTSTSISTPKSLSATKSSTPTLSVGSKSSSPSESVPSPQSSLTPAERAARREQERQEKIAERTAKQQEIRQKIEEEKQRRKEEREKEREKKREEKKQQMEKLKEWSRPRDDLECDDLKPFPEMQELRTRVPTHLFGDAIMVLEYINAFKNVFDFKQFFPKGFTWRDVESGLIFRDPQGPLCDLLQMLLCALFNLQEEEAEEYQALEKEETDDLDKKPLTGDDEQNEEDDQVSNNELIRSATLFAQHSQLTFGMPLKDTMLDQFTLTEILRLHLLSSGSKANSRNARFRYQQRGGYSSLDDPGLELRRQDPGLLKKLQIGNVFDFKPEDKLRVVVTLVQQVMTYAAVRDMVEETYDKLRVKKYDLKLLQWAEVRRIKEDQAMQYKRQLEEKQKERDYRLKELTRAEQIRQAKEQGVELPPIEDPPETAEQRQQREDRERQEEARRRADYAKRELEALQCIVDLQRTNALYPLGRDRHYRRYWLFSSLPALMVEDNELFLFSSACPAGTTEDDHEMPQLTRQEDHDISGSDHQQEELETSSSENRQEENTAETGNQHDDAHNTSSDKENELNRAGSQIGTIVNGAAKNGDTTAISDSKDSTLPVKEKFLALDSEKVVSESKGRDPSVKKVGATDTERLSQEQDSESLSQEKDTERLSKEQDTERLSNEQDTLFQKQDTKRLSQEQSQPGKVREADSQSAQSTPISVACNKVDADSETGESISTSMGVSKLHHTDTEAAPVKLERRDTETSNPGLELPRLESSPLEHLLGQQEARWYVVHSRECLEGLLATLNLRGFRESALHAALTDYTPFIKLVIDACPLDSLCPQPENQKDQSGPKSHMQTRASGPATLVDGTTQSDSASEAIELTLRDGLLDLEERIFVGSLGGIKVKDRGVWRVALESGGYDPQTDEMPFALIQSPKKDRREKEEMHVPEEHVARDLSHALVQIARGVEPRFIKAPLGESGEDGKKKNSKEDKHESTDKELRRRTYDRWEESLLCSSSLSQVFLHLASLDKSITWDRSALMARCRICRRKADPEKMLLCDKCDRGHHMYCLTPPMTKIPSGDWFCPNCRPKQPPPSPRKNRRRTFSEVEEEEEEDRMELQDTIQEEASDHEEEMEQDSDREEGREEEEEEEEEDSEDEENEDVCAVCHEDGRLILCDVCPRSYHMHCARPMLRKVPKGKWMCQVCVEGGRAGKIQLGRPRLKAGAGNKARDTARKETIKLAGGSTSSKTWGGKSGSCPGSRRETPRNSPTPTSRVGKKYDTLIQDITPKGSGSGHRGREVTPRQRGGQQDKDWTPKGGDKTTSRGGDKTTPKGGDKMTPRGGDKMTPRGGDKATAAVTQSKRGSMSRLSTDGEFEISARQYTSSKRGNSQVQQMRVAEDLLQELIKHPDAWPFLAPVDKKLVPDYYDVITQPMDLCTIRNKVHAFQYTLPTQLLSDVRLIFANCVEYNARNTPEYRAGQTLHKFFDSRVRELGLCADSSPATPPPAKKQRR